MSAPTIKYLTMTDSRLIWKQGPWLQLLSGTFFLCAGLLFLTVVYNSLFGYQATCNRAGNGAVNCTFQRQFFGIPTSPAQEIAGITNVDLEYSYGDNIRNGRSVSPKQIDLQTTQGVVILKARTSTVIPFINALRRYIVQRRDVLTLTQSSSDGVLVICTVVAAVALLIGLAMMLTSVTLTVTLSRQDQTVTIVRHGLIIHSVQQWPLEDIVYAFAKTDINDNTGSNARRKTTLSYRPCLNFKSRKPLPLTFNTYSGNKGMVWSQTAVDAINGWLRNSVST